MDHQSGSSQCNAMVTKLFCLKGRVNVQRELEACYRCESLLLMGIMPAIPAQ